MEHTNNEFTMVTALLAEALGQPGNRTFRILVESGTGSATMWLEKEQLFDLSLAVQQLLAKLAGKKATPNPPTPTPEGSVSARLDFKVVRLMIGYDDGRGLFIIDCYDSPGESASTARIWATKDQVKDFAENALQVCASGRPICPLCGFVITLEGHSCPRANGHVKMPDF